MMVERAGLVEESCMRGVTIGEWAKPRLLLARWEERRSPARLLDARSGMGKTARRLASAREDDARMVLVVLATLGLMTSTELFFERLKQRYNLRN
jgi:hypothetical protein